MLIQFARSIPKPSPPEPAGAWPVLLVVLFSMVCSGIAVISRTFGWEVSPLTWYVARASGVTLYLLLWASTAFGLALTTHLLDRFITRSLVYSVHAYLTALSLAFLGLHLLALALDIYTQFTLSDLFVPFSSGIREPWTGFGVTAAWLLLIITVSFQIRAIAGFRIWRKTHWLTFPLMIVGIAHGIGAGTDSAATPMMAVYVGTGGIILFLIFYRLLRSRRRHLLAPEGDGVLDRMLARSPRNPHPREHVLPSHGKTHA